MRNHETGEPMADVKVEQYRRKGWLDDAREALTGTFSLSPFGLAATKRTGKDGKAVFQGKPDEGWYHVYSNTRSPIRFNLDGKEIVSHVNETRKNRINVFEVGYQQKGSPDPSPNLHVSGFWEYKDELTVYIGTYTGGTGSKGIYRIRADRAKGVFSKPELVAEVDNPSFLAQDNWKGDFLYAVSESSNKVFAYSGADGDGMLTLLNEAQTGAGPCHVAVGYLGLVVADYGDGSIAAWRCEIEGHIGERIAFMQNTYAGKATGRQQNPHAHGATFTHGYPGFLLVPDLGADRVYVYEVIPNKAIAPHKTAPWIGLPPGRGPRHVESTHWVYPGNPHNLYVLNELSNTISVFECDLKQGLFTFVEEVSTLPAGFAGESTAAELIVKDDVLYATNRGHDSIARFRRDPKTGRLTLAECVPCGGKWPRHFALLPGRSWKESWMLVANQHSNNIAVFRVAEDGALKPMPDAGIEIPAPACILF